jgi:hypothetical protein
MGRSEVLNKFRDLFPWPNRRCVELLFADRTSGHAYVLIGRSFEKRFDYHVAILPQVVPVRHAFLCRDKLAAIRGRDHLGSLKYGSRKL